MGRITDLLKGSAGEQGLFSALGRWRLALAQATDNLVTVVDGIVLSLSANGIFSYGGNRAQMGFAEVTTPGNAPTTVVSFDTTGLADSNYMATAQFSAKGGGVAMLTRRRPFQVVGGVLSAIDAIEEIGTDVGADVGSVAVDIAVNAASIDFNVTGIAATNLDWVVEWGVSRY